MGHILLLPFVHRVRCTYANDILCIGPTGQVTEELLTLQITNPALENVLAAIEALDNAITKNPADFWEWRLANIRLCDFGLIPLIPSARVMVSTSTVQDRTRTAPHRTECTGLWTFISLYSRLSSALASGVGYDSYSETAFVALLHCALI